MVKRLLLLTILLSLFQITAGFSQITIGTVDPGPYGYGSHITVPIIIPQTASCLPRTGNLFNLYLSDETGNFVNERLIGSYAGFYTNFVNGIIPTGAPALVPGSNYKLRVKITGDNSIIEYPTPITIQGVTMPDIAVEPSSTTQILGIDTYGFCGSSISDGKNIILTNKSAASVTTQLILKNELSNSSQTYSPGPVGFQITNLANSYYTAQLNGNQSISGVLIKSNKSYLLLNSTSKVSIQSTGDGFGCIDPATGNIAPVSYFVTLNGASGILNNYPGSTYRINWGDGTDPDFYTHCELVEKNGAMTHNFAQTSCGQPPIDLGGGNQVTNAFRISVTTINPFCTSDPNSALSYAKIYVKPIAKINPPLPVACLNRTVTFNNGTTAGYNSNCTRTMLYEWYVDGVLMATTETFSYAFPTNGLHEVKLIAKNDVGICSPSEAIFNICIQAPPKPAFDFTGNSTAHCAPFEITANDKSIVDAICNTNNTYNWIVTKSGRPALASEVTFTNGISEPKFTFLKQGTYQVTLQINTATCGPVSTTPPQTVVIIDSAPKTTLAETAIYCGLGTYTYNNTIAGPTNVQFSGTEVDATDTYTWSVTAANGDPLPIGDYSFTNGTNITKYPSIKFNQYITYKVSVTHKNSCGTITTDQLITFKESPSPSIIAPAICYNTNASITGSISNTNYIGYVWSTPLGGGSFLNANTLTPTYVPSPADLIAGKATVILTVNTGLGGVCEFVSKPEEFIIHPNNTGTNATQIICTGDAAKLTLGSSVIGSTFGWTAANADGFAAGFSPSGSGDINQTITNTNATQNAVVVYTITPTANGCAGVPFTFTVTVTPKPIIDPVLDKTICQDNPVSITVTSNIPTQFKWTSNASSSSVTGHSNPSALSPTSGSITIPDVLLNPTFLPQTVTYTITPYSPGGCAGAPITVVVTVDPAVTPANAGPDASLCATGASNAYRLKGNKPDVGTGVWKLVSTHLSTLPVIDVPTDFETTVRGLLVGETYRFEWAITGAGACSNSADLVDITFTPLPVISVPVTDKTICQNNLAAITINSDIPTQFIWTSVASSPGITGHSNPTTRSAILNTITINDLLLNSDFAQGTVTYTITPYSPTGCEGAPITIVVKVDPAVTTATAGANTSICNTTTYDLKGSEPKVGTGLWTVVSASLGTPSIPNPTDFETTVSDLVAGGIYVFKWTITGAGVCQKSEADVTITVNMPTIPGTTTGAQTVCQNNGIGTITLTGNTGSVLSWQSLPDGQTTWEDLPGTNTGLTYTFTPLNITTQFRAVVQNAGCIIQYSTPTTITVAPATTTADAGPDQTLCAEASVSLKGNPVKSGETGLWTMVSGDANADITTPTNNVTTVTALTPNVTYVFRWTITGNSPCGPTSKIVTIRNNRALDLNSLTSTAVVCNGQQVVINGSVPIGGDEGHYNYAWESKLDAGAWNVIPGEVGKDLTITLTTPGIVSIRRIVNSGTCTSTSNPFPITVQPPIDKNTIAADQTICSGLIPNSIIGDLPTGGDGQFIYQWQSSLDGTTWANITGAVSQNYQPPALTMTTYYRRIVSTIECSGNLQSISGVVKKTVIPNAKAEFTWANDQDCVPYTLPIQVVAYPDRNAIYTWSANNTVIGTGSTFPGYTISTSGQVVTIKLEVTSSLGCSADVFSHEFSTNQAVPASFSQSETEGCAPLVVNFTNNSLLTAGATFKWDFGNGQTSTATHPTGITFQQDPTGKDITYIVTLTSITSCGENSATSTVLVKAKPIARFSPSKTEGCSPMLVNFSNTSPGGSNKYYYDFGDGTAVFERTDKSPISHTYNTSTTKEFTVTMTAVNECGTDVKTYTIKVYPQNMTPELVVNGNQNRGCAPFTVNFDNNTIGASHFTFDFGDGGTRNTTVPGTEQYTFTRPGRYTVKMTAFNSCSEMTEEETIIVLEQPLPAFHAEVTLGCADLPVQFRNTTQGGITYLWDFGDGTTSSETEPLHIYKGDQEYYTVTLTATNTLGCSDKVTRNQYIRVVPPPIAAFNVNPSTLISIPDYTFKFEDESTNNPTIWEWNFGDKLGTSRLRNPSYTYLDTGTYKVTLKVTNQNGCFTTTFKNVTIKGVPGYLFVPNSFIPGNTLPELREFRAKGSGIASWRFSVFNKWGQILWETTKLDEGRPAEAWDGTFKGQPMPQGVYYWKIDVQMINGTEWKGMTYDKSVPKRTGAIHLIR